jgi:hypothetical protein
MTSKTQEVAIGFSVLLIGLPVAILILYHYGAIHDLQSVIDQTIAGALAAIAFGAILIIVHAFTKKEKHPADKTSKPNFDHVEARLFFPATTLRNQRDLNHVPHKN